MILVKVPEADKKILVEKVHKNSAYLMAKYYRIIKLNSIQHQHNKVGSGRDYAVKPSGTNKGNSRVPRTIIPGKGNVAKGRPGNVGGPRGYHDRLTKKLLIMNKKERKLTYKQIMLCNLLYENAYIINDIDLKNRVNTLKQLKLLIPYSLNTRVNRRRVFKKSAVIIHGDINVVKMYRNTTLDLFDIANPNYNVLELFSNSNHLVLFSQLTYKKILNETL